MGSYFDWRRVKRLSGDSRGGCDVVFDADASCLSEFTQRIR